MVPPAQSVSRLVCPRFLCDNCCKKDRLSHGSIKPPILLCKCPRAFYHGRAGLMWESQQPSAGPVRPIAAQVIISICFYNGEWWMVESGLNRELKDFRVFFFSLKPIGYYSPHCSFSDCIHPIKLFPGFCEAITPPPSQRQERLWTGASHRKGFKPEKSDVPFTVNKNMGLFICKTFSAITYLAVSEVRQFHPAVNSAGNTG